MIKCTKGQVRRFENSAAMENTAGATSAHPDGVAARERNDAAFDCHGNGRVA